MLLFTLGYIAGTIILAIAVFILLMHKDNNSRD